MHIQLKNWGLAGLLPSGNDTQTVARGASGEGRGRKARAGGGGAEELPPASSATEPFREAIAGLTQAVENLRHLKVVYQDGRFFSTYVNKDPVHLPRASFSDEDWQALCELYDHDLDAEVFVDTNASMTNPIDASPAPPRPLVVLIAVYALMNGYLGALLKALHPNPSEAETERINRLLYARKGPKSKGGDDRDGLLRTAEQLATLVCGGTIAKGPPPEELPSLEHNAACLITWRRDQGWSEDEIHEQLRHQGFTKEDVSRLGQLGLRWPED